MEVLFKEIDILTSFGPIQPFLGTFVLSKETSLSRTVVINSIFPGKCPSIRRSNCVEREQNLGQKTTITNAKVDVEKFDGRNNFGLWKSDMKDALYMLDLDQVLKGTKPDDSSESEWERINIKTCGLIRSCLAKEQRYTFLQETSVYSLWKALENKYIKKSNENRLSLLKRLFHL